MFKNILQITVAVAAGLVLNGVANSQSRWGFMETYSNADGSIQFIVLEYNGNSTKPPVLAGQTLISSDGTTERSFTFANDVTHHFSDYGFDTASCDGEDGCWAYALVATQGFAALHLVQPDFVVANGFLPLPNGSVRLSARVHDYGILPVDGENALWGDAGDVFRAEALNNLGESYVFMPAGINNVVEYYSAGLDDYFLTAYPWEIQGLDNFGGDFWKRTGYTLPAWTSPFSTSKPTPSNLAAVCRLWLRDSHFFSISTTECAAVLAQYRVQNVDVHESVAAFYATLPDAETGACPVGQTRVYRLWNPRGSGHRYTTEPAVRDEMLTRGYISEGYGPDSVAMCVGGNG